MAVELKLLLAPRASVALKAAALILSADMTVEKAFQAIVSNCIAL